MSDEQTELERECDKCADYIMMRLQEESGVYTKEELAMWIHDHFAEERGQKITIEFSDVETVKHMIDFLNLRSDEGTEDCPFPPSTKYDNFLFDLTKTLENANKGCDAQPQRRDILL